MVVDDSLFTDEHDDGQYTNQYLEFLQDNMYDDKQVEEMKEIQKEKKERKGALDEFME